MHSNELTVPLFLVGAALTMAVCAITIAGWKHKILVWGLLSFAFLLAMLGVFWGPVSTEVPGLGTALTSVATTQFVWFLAIVAALISTISSNMKVRRLRNSNSTDLAVIDREYRDAKRLDSVEISVTSLQAELESAKDGRLAKRLDEIERKIPVIIQDYQTVRGEQTQAVERYATHADIHRLDEQLSDIRDKLKFVRDLAEAGPASVKTIVDNALDEKLSDFKAATIRNFDEMMGVFRQRFENIDGGFLAISHLEWAKRLATELDEKSERLLAEADKVDSDAKWREWAQSEDTWRTDLDQLLMVAESYLPGTTDKIRSTAGYEDAHWPRHNPTFSGAQVRRYQDFVIRVENLRKHRSKIEKAIYQRAFLRPSMKGEGTQIG